MTVLRRLYPLCFLTFVIGCAKSTADGAKEMKATDPSARLHAVHALQDRVREKATVVPVLTEALQDEDTYVRRDAAKALGHFGPEAREAIPPLLARLRDKEPNVRKAAGQALKQIDPTAAAEAGVR